MPPIVGSSSAKRDAAADASLIKSKCREQHGSSDLAVFGWNIPQLPRECGDLLGRPFEVDPRCRRRPFGKTNSGTPLADRPDRAWRKPATAIRADIEQNLVDALGAERALERTNSRIHRVGRQVLVAIFAIGSQLQHQPVPSYRMCCEPPSRRFDSFSPLLRGRFVLLAKACQDRGWGGFR